MQSLNPSRVLQRGRRRLVPSVLPNIRVAKTAGLVALLIFLLTEGLYLPHSEDRSKTNIQVTQGTEEIDADFRLKRGYIRYQIAGGKRYYYAAIASRFAVSRGWKEVAATTLNLRMARVDASELEKLQFKLDAGQEVKVPICDAAQSW